MRYKSLEQGRRNWTPNEVALQAAEEYEEEKAASGVRTDLRGGQAINTAKAVGERYGKTDRWVHEAVAFSNAIRALRDNVGVDFPEELIQDEKPLVNRDQVITIAQAPANVQREALELVKKRNAAGVRSAIEKAQRLAEGMPSRSIKTTGDDKPSVTKFDLATLVYAVDSWSMEMVEAYNPVTDERAMSYLRTHLGGAIEKLITLAEVNGYAGEVLDDYVARRGWGTTVDSPEATAWPELPAEEPEVDPLEDLRRRTRDHLGDEALSSYAARAGIGAGTLKTFLDGGRVYAKTVVSLEAMLTR